ncbi:MAG: LLM class flavin-dependent oxidoreductase [Chloroflexi bacterium]|nr:LLM class flavin-dependent oxidoreductase [Chloroflexota bacterium]
MKYGFILPFGDARSAAEMAQLAEQAGWDGFFVFETVWGPDAWILLTAAAMKTETIRLGTMITPVSRMKPWKLASETATLDHLSGGRVILAVGLGAVDTGFAEFGEVTDRKQRAELLDEGLDILTGLWRGQPFSYQGKHYQIKECKFPLTPPPLVQQPRIPIWVVGAWPRPKSMARVIQWDGLLPVKMDDKKQHQPATPDDLRAMQAYIAERRTQTTPFDVVMEGQTPGKDRAKDAAVVRPFIEAGATWWLEAMWQTQSADLDVVRTRIRLGPPRG